MKINNTHIEFVYEHARYNTIEDVPLWRVYIKRREKVNEYYRKTETIIVYKSIFAYTYDDLLDYIKKCHFVKGEYVVAYARKSHKRVKSFL